MIKKLKVYWGGKSLKQRIYIFIALSAMLTLAFFTVKANFFDRPKADSPPQTEISAAIGESGEAVDDTPIEKEPEFHISFIDIGVLLVVVGAYCVHKFREKKKQGRL